MTSVRNTCTIGSGYFTEALVLLKLILTTYFRNYEFEFPNIEKPYESYTGTNVKLRYYVRATVLRGMATPNIGIFNRVI